jgi:hypothetical protein
MSPDTQGAILDLVLQKKIDDFQLPEDLIIVMSGNIGDEDGTFARPITSALTGGRAMVFAMVPPSIKEWFTYEKDINAGIKEYLEANPYSLYEKPHREKPHEPWSCPRSWSRFNEWCKHVGLDVKKDQEKFLMDAELFLSPVTAAEMRDHFEKSAIDVERLVKGAVDTWEKFKAAKDFRQIATIRKVVKEVFDNSASIDNKLKDAQDLLDRMEKIKIKDQVVSEFISGASKFYVGPVFERLTYKGQKVGRYFDELVLGIGDED